nr:hypothetical protein [Gemmatimonadota bacterium]
MNEHLPKLYVGQLPAAHSGDAGYGLPRIPYSEPRQPTVLRQIWDMLVRRRWTMLVAFLTVVSAAVYATSRMARTYTSSATILVGKASKAEEGATFDVLSELGASGEVETELRLLESRRIADPVVDKYDLHVKVTTPQGLRPSEILPGFEASNDAVPGTYSIRSTGRGSYVLRRTDPDEAVLGTYPAGAKVKVAGLAFELPAKLPASGVWLQVNTFTSALGRVLENTTAFMPDPNAKFISLECHADHPQSAYHICLGISESYVALRNELQRADAVNAAKFLRQQSESVKGQLVEAEEELQRYQEAHQAIAPDVQGTQEIAQFAMLQSKRDQLEAERVALAGLMVEARRAGGGTAQYRGLASYPTFLGNPMVGDILHNLVNYENQLHELSKRRTDDNPDVVAIRQRITELEGQLGSVARNYESSLAAQIGSIEGTLGRSRGRLGAVPEKTTEVARLQRKTDLLSQLYTTLQQRLRESEIAEAVELADLSIIDPAMLPTSPSSPNVKLNLALAVAAGLLFSLGAGLVQEFADTRVRRRDDVERD